MSIFNWQDSDTEIKIYTTGGTIDKLKSKSGSKYRVGRSKIEYTLEEANVSFDYSISSILQKDSLYMDDKDIQLIFNTVKNSSHKYIVITHGTDTIVQTAKKMESMEGKVIVLTGAFKPAKCKSSDATFNIGYAIASVQLLKPGVYITMNGSIFNPDETRKNLEMNTFEYII